MNYIECPICEQQFSETSAEQVITCPSCQRKFLASSAGRVPLTTKPTNTETLPRPEIVEQNAEAQKEIKKRQSNKPLELQPDRQADSASGDPKRLKKKSAVVRARSKRRKRKRLAATVIASVAFAVISGILSGVLVMQVSKKNSEEKIANLASSIANESADNKSETNISGSTPTSSDKSMRVSTPVPEKPIKLEDLPERKTRFHKQADLTECWDVVRPHLVALKVHDVRGTHDAVGTIIDSRGWIVTSYRAILGATKIEVAASAKVIDEIGEDHLMDEVRGIVSTASDQDLDIAVLTINPRFVVHFADIKLANFVRIVSGSYLAQCAPPSRENPYARTEANIKSRGNVNSVPGTSETALGDLGSPDITWLTAESETQPLPGTPLTTITGELAAINSSFNDKKGYYVLLNNLARLIQDSDGIVKPLSTLGGLSSDDGTVQINQFHPLLADIQKLNQLGDVCAEFDWIATDQDQYSRLQQFGMQIAIIKKYATDNPDEDKELLKPVEEQLSRWQNTLLQKYSSAYQADREKIKEMNLLAEQQLKKGEQCVPLVAASHTPDFSQNRLVFQMAGLDSGVSILFDPDADPKRPSINFLLFVMTPAQPKTVNYTLTSGSLSAHSVELFFDVGPIQ